MAEIIVTGGTFDKDHDQRKGKLVFPEDDTSVREILERARVMGHTVTTAMMIDSMDMTEHHRGLIARLCGESTEDSIVVTHGTDTMRETALVIQEYGLDKTIVLTGAMRPHRLGDSDGSFNLGFALAASELLPRGVHIAMNGQVLSPQNVRKNRMTLRFEERT